ncbi:hypothetical protein HDU98_012175 [Podochytrium sp. JEL0797]|nr:hypothetical protein HDU98_012175 [Podochytrium sp. JEL0797]
MAGSEPVFFRRVLDSDQAKAVTKANAIVLASTSSAVASVVAGYPFDLIKTRMQAFRYPSNMACIKEIYTLDGGMIGFFRGMAPILVTVSIFRTISFSAYTSVKPVLMNQFENPSTFPRNLQSILDTLAIPVQVDRYIASIPAVSLPSMNLNISWEPLKDHAKSYLSPESVARINTMQTPSSAHVWSSILAGSCAGSIVATLNAPLEFIKIQRQLDTKMRHTPLSSNVIEKMVESSAGAVASGTAGGLGEGAAVSSVTKMMEQRESAAVKKPRVGGGKGVKHRHLNAWEWGRRIVREKGVLGLYSGYSYHLARDLIGTGMYFGGYESMKVLFTPRGEVAGSMVHMMAGGLSGTLSWIILFPIDLTKSVMQKEAMQPIPKYTSARQFIARRFKSGGIRGFYHGIGAQLTRSFPVHAMNFLIYEHVLKWCRR